MLSIKRETPDQPEVAILLRQADERSSAVYPAKSRHGLNVAELLSQKVRFFVARVDGKAVGCGGYALGPDAAELKRLFVAPAARGHGVGRGILQALEDAADREGARRMRLETGIKSTEALRLYERSGYTQIAPFGAYASDPLSVFMERTLAPDVG